MTLTRDWPLTRIQVKGRKMLRKGFTLIELLVVIAIIGLLVGLVTSIGGYVYKEAARRETQTTQAVVMSTVERFWEITNEYPDDQPVGTFTTPGEIGILLYHLKVEDKTIYPVAMNARIVKATAEKLQHLSQDAFYKDEVYGLVLADGWGMPMQYSKIGGLGRRPLLISGGPDKKLSTQNDNIRSDEG